MESDWRDDVHYQAWRDRCHLIALGKCSSCSYCYFKIVVKYLSRKIYRLHHLLRVRFSSVRYIPVVQPISRAFFIFPN